MNESSTILLVEDSPRDEELTIRALRKNRIGNEIVVAHGGTEALDYLLARGAHAARSHAAPPQLVLLDLKLPKVDGLEVLRQIRADERTRLVLVVILGLYWLVLNERPPYPGAAEKPR
jgi:two-component system response regulator